MESERRIWTEREREEAAELTKRQTRCAGSARTPRLMGMSSSLSASASSTALTLTRSSSLTLMSGWLMRTSAVVPSVASLRLPSELWSSRELVSHSLRRSAVERRTRASPAASAALRGGGGATPRRPRRPQSRLSQVGRKRKLSVCARTTSRCSQRRDVTSTRTT